MKKTVSLFFMVLMACLIASCSSDNYAEGNEVTEISGFLHREVLCEGSAAIIGNAEELQQKLPDGYTQYSNKVDFSKSSLLLIFGTSNYGVNDITKRMAGDSGRYVFDIAVKQDMTCVMDDWCIAYIVPKNTKGEDVNVNITYGNIY
ncbi:MAG: hypothetical protein HUK08_09960 [Bacteroidaceae bacterium]|nr:hypothetical protein [Bacteroidaceae bacterium]